MTSEPREFCPRGERGKVLIRQFSTFEDYLACERMQEDTWGKGFHGLVPSSILLVSQKIGGIAAGAFDAKGSLIGFVFGMVGYREGKRIHWSDMLAVDPGWRDSGIGTQLKLFQREEAKELGIGEMYWSFDPLVARNAHLNLARLGAAITAYVPDMYPDMSSELHRDLGMDRCIAVWQTTAPAVKDPLSSGTIEVGENDPVVNTFSAGGGASVPVVRSLPDAPRILIEVPRDIFAVRQLSEDTARRWRESTRHAFVYYLDRGYRVTAFVPAPPGNRFFYLLASTSSAEAPI
jgi:predicted GNAT superfamily acetyltransferase